MERTKTKNKKKNNREANDRKKNYKVIKKAQATRHDIRNWLHLIHIMLTTQSMKSKEMYRK
jgi:hypothetical protein